MKLIYILSGLLLWLISAPAIAQASTEFDTSFSSTYSFTETDDATVIHQIEIKNKLSYLYTSEYTIAIGTTQVENLRVEIYGKKTTFRLNDSGDITSLTIDIPEPAIGKDKVLPITISYTTPDLIQKFGLVREINIPRLNKANEASVYTRRIIVPASFGSPTVTSPRSSSESMDEAGNILIDYIGFPADGIALLFGESVTYRIDLTYEIVNPTLTLTDTEIALPPDTNYQRVYLENIDPSPSRIYTDSDGNWLAVYPLKSQESKKIKSTAIVSVYPRPHTSSDVKLETYLTSPQEYWQADAEFIRSLALDLKSPLNIYNYLVDNMTYDFERIRSGARLGAEKALSQPGSAVCTEFTDSFIALTRALDIPAREINGYAWTSDQSLKPTGISEDILHSWPEFYDQSTSSWIQIDPTWGNTTGGIDYYNKMDYGHIAFAIHGREPDYPHPAGTYKNSDQEKTVNVALTDSHPAADERYRLYQENGGWMVLNEGKSALKNYIVKLPGGTTETISYLPPMGTLSLDTLNRDKDSFWYRLSTFFSRIFRFDTKRFNL